MAATIQAIITQAIIAAWPKLEPLIVKALSDALRKGLLAIKAKTVPDSSPFKPLEAIADQVIDDVLALLPA